MSFASDLRALLDSHHDRLVVRSLREFGVSLKNIRTSLANLAARDPKLLERTLMLLRREGVIVNGEIQDKVVERLVISNDRFVERYALFKQTWWGLTGEMVRLAGKYSPAMLLAMAFKQQFIGKNSELNKTLTTSLRSTGLLAEQGSLAVMKESIKYAALEANVSEQLRRYDVSMGKEGDRRLAADYVKYFGNNAALARQVFARLGLISKQTGVAVDEFFDILVKQRSLLGHHALKSVNDLHVSIEMFRRVGRQIESHRDYTDPEGAQTQWPQLMTASFIAAHKMLGKNATNVNGLAKAVANAYLKASKFTKSQKLVQQHADAYIHVIRGTDWMRFQVGTQVLENIDARIKEVQKVKTRVAQEDAIRAVLRESLDENQLAVGESIVKAYLEGERTLSPEAMIELMQSNDRGFGQVHKLINQKFTDSSTDGIVLMLEAQGVSHASAVMAAAGRDAAGLLAIDKEGELARGAQEVNVKHALASARYLVEGEATATDVFNRFYAYVARFVATPLGKAAAALGAFTIKGIVDDFYKLKMMRDWFITGFSYAKTAGLTAATNWRRFALADFLQGGRVFSDLRGLGAFVGKFALVGAVGAHAIHKGTQIAERRFPPVGETDSEIERGGMKVLEGRKVPDRPKLADPKALDPRRIARDVERDRDLRKPQERPLRKSELAVPAATADNTAIEEAKRRDTERSARTRREREEARRPPPLADPVDDTKAWEMSARVISPQADLVANYAKTNQALGKRMQENKRRDEAPAQTIMFRPRSAEEAELVASGIPVTAAGRVALSVMAKLESVRRMNAFRGLWFSAMGAQVKSTEQGKEFVEATFTGFGDIIVGVHTKQKVKVTPR